MSKAFTLKKALLSAAAAAMAAGALAPAAAAGGYHGRGHHAHAGWGHYKAPRHYKRPKYYHGSRHYRRRHHRGGLSGGEAALLAAGIIGGIILIDQAIENDRRRDAYDPYYAPPRRDDFYYRRDDRAPAPAAPYDDYDRDYEDDLDEDLLGGGYDERYDGRSSPAYAADYNYGAAYNDCKAETRAAADAAGVIVALPAKPQRIQPIEDGTAVRFVADYLAQGRGGEWRRTMVCEADESGVRFLELV